MLILTGGQLINWHRFSNERFTIKGSCLITGGNKAGKTTFLDALQLCLVGDKGKVHLNAAESGKNDRSVLKYVRGQIEGEGFIYTGDITSYVAMEFYDDQSDSNFIIGLVMDSNEAKITQTTFFKIETELKQSYFFKSLPKKDSPGVPRSAKEFKKFIEDIPNIRSTVKDTVKEYRKMLKARFQVNEDRFFELVTKSVGFKPIEDINSFVNEFMLESKPLELEDMQAVIVNWKGVEDDIAKCEQKVARLSNISETYGETLKTKESITKQEYLISRAELEDIQEKIVSKSQLVKDVKKAIVAIEEQAKTLKTLLRREESERDRLLASLHSIEGYAQVNSIKEKIKEVKRNLQLLKDNQDRLEADVFALLESLRLDIFSDVQLIQDVTASLDRLIDGSKKVSISNLISALTHLRGALQEVKTQLDNAFRELNAKKQELLGEKDSVQRIIKSLELGRRHYRPNVTNLISEIQNHFSDKGIAMKPQPLCELIEVRDERWRDAVEGYLNTRRFDLFVPVEYFDESLAIYEKCKRKGDVAGVGLVNIAAVLEEERFIGDKSLANEVISDNPNAKAYSDYVIGNLIKVDSEQELKKHRRAITSSVMVYQNNAARKTKPYVYETWYIGANALKQQSTNCKKKMEAILEQIFCLDKKIEPINAYKKQLDIFTLAQRIGFIKENLSVYRRITETKNNLASLEAEYDRLNSHEVNKLTFRLNEVESSIELNRDKEGQLREDIGIKKNSVMRFKADIQKLNDTLADLKVEIKTMREVNPGIADQADKELEKEAKTKSYIDIKASKERGKTRNETTLRKQQKELYDLLIRYSEDYDFGGVPDVEDISPFKQQLEDLVSYHLPRYRMQVIDLRKMAESEFKEDFVNRLKENFDDAREEIKRLNGALQLRNFGSDKYEFTVDPTPDKRHFYRMIMETEKFEGPLFDMNSAYERKYQKQIDTLFEYLAKTDPDNLDIKAEEFIDYRSYLRFDVEVTNALGEKSAYSKRGGTDSKSEKEILFYVAVVSSFMELYGAGYADEPNTVRLVLMDEVFPSIDPQRTQQAMDFLASFNLQPVFIGQFDKIENIQKFVDTILYFQPSDTSHYTTVFDYKLCEKEIKEMLENGEESAYQTEQRRAN